MKKYSKNIKRLLLFILTCCIFSVVFSITGKFVNYFSTKDYWLIKEKTESLIDTIFGDKHSEEERAYLEEQNKEIDFINSIYKLCEDQNNIDKQLLIEFENKNNTFDNPFVIVNPYGISPLTAVVIFSTDEEVKVFVEVVGKDDLSTVSYDFNKYEKNHIIPIYGLYPNQENKVIISITNQNNECIDKELSVITDILPPQYNNYRVYAHSLQKQKYSPGFNFTYRGNNHEFFRSAIDINGEFRWCLDNTKYTCMKDCLSGYGSYNDSKSVFIAVRSITYTDEERNVYIIELDYLGKVLNVFYSSYGFHHDMEITDDYLYCLGGEKNEVNEALVYKINRNTGEIEKKINYINILLPIRNQLIDGGDTEYYNPNDWCHMNSVRLDEDNSIVISSRNQSTIISTDEEGNINWMLCNPEGYYEYYKQFILKPIGNDFIYPNCQHFANVLDDQDNNDDTIDLLIFDNGCLREEKVSQMIQYRINKKKMTVEVVFKYGEDKPELFSRVHGSSIMLSNGNYLGSFEPQDTLTGNISSYIIEADKNGNPVWECWKTTKDIASKCYEYRIDRLEMYNDYSSIIHIGEKANLFMPEDQEK